MQESTLSSYADDTQPFFAYSDCNEVESVINLDLPLVDKWYDQNGLKRNNSKYQAAVMGKTVNKPSFKCDSKVIPSTSAFEMLGVNIDDQLKFDDHVSKICTKISQQIAVLKRMKKCSPSKLGAIYIYLLLFRILAIALRHGTFVVRVPLINWRKLINVLLDLCLETGIPVIKNCLDN